VEWREAESTEQPPRERRETRGRANELGLGLGACSAGAGLYIGREGRPGSNGHREGWPGSNDHRAWGRAGYWSGPCPCRAGVLGIQPNTGTGVGPCLARARGRPGRFVLGPCFIGPCSCRPVGLSPFGHLYFQKLCSLIFCGSSQYRPRSLFLSKAKQSVHPTLSPSSMLENVKRMPLCSFQKQNRASIRSFHPRPCSKTSMASFSVIFYVS
jgi:hypothetical protein